MTRSAQLRAPAEHLGLLIEPAAAQLGAWLAAAGVPRSWRAARILDTTVDVLRAELHEQLDLAGPVVLTGHQLEFFHAGVLAKLVAAHRLAAQCGGTAAFLAVDSDLPKTAVLALPQTTSAGVRQVDVAIPGCEPAAPLEFQPSTPREHWLQFFARVAALHELYDRSLLPVFARAWLAASGPAQECGAAALAAQAAATEALGLHGMRTVRVSQLAETRAFRAFVAHWLLDARRLAEAYNAAVADYRDRHRVRAAGRPVPSLTIADDAVELPFWLVRPGEPRARLCVAARGDGLELRADTRPVGELARHELERAAAHADPWSLAADGWRVRPRALALSAFARLVAADLFIHGIGGAKYDEVMENFVRAIFGVEPAPAGCVTATLHLPLPHAGVRPAEIAAARRASRDLRFNPQRHLLRVPENLLSERAELVRRCRELQTRDPHDHAARRLVFQAIRRVSAQMLETDPWRVAQYDQRVQMLEQQRQLDRIALDREYFYALHPEAVLRALCDALADRLRFTPE